MRCLLVSPQAGYSKTRIIHEFYFHVRTYGGVWYKIKFRKLSDAKLTDFAYDKLTRQTVWPGKRHAYLKEQLSAADRTAFGVVNHSDG